MEKDGKGVVHAPPGDGGCLWVVGGTYILKATTENTDGALFVLEASVPPRGGPPQQIHHRTDEAFNVLEGGSRCYTTNAPSWRERARSS